MPSVEVIAVFHFVENGRQQQQWEETAEIHNTNNIHFLITHHLEQISPAHVYYLYNNVYEYLKEKPRIWLDFKS